MKKLKAGDIRKQGDEYAELTIIGERIKCVKPWTTHSEGLTGFHPVTTLIGHPILESDLMHLQFRRP